MFVDFFDSFGVMVDQRNPCTKILVELRGEFDGQKLFNFPKTMQLVEKLKGELLKVNLAHKKFYPWLKL